MLIIMQKKIYLLSVIFISIPLTSWAQYTGGNGGGASSDSSVLGTVVNGTTIAPANNANLIVDANTAITNSPTLNSITVNPGKKLTINTGVTVTLPANGKVRLKAKGNTYSQLRIVGGLSLGTGATLIQEQNVNSPGWYNLGSSISNGVSTFGTVNANAPGATSNTSNLKYWDATASQWANVSDADNILPGRGYNAFVGTFGVLPENSKLELEGTPITTVTPAIAYHNPGGVAGFGVGPTDGWNFLANPFAAALDFDALNLTNVEDAYYIWDAAANGGNGGYLSWSGAVGATNTLTQYIPPLQGFWVRALSGSPAPSIGTLDYATHTVDTENPTFRKTSAIKGHLVLSILDATSNILQDGLTIAFVPGTKSGFDNGWDARKMYNPAPSVNFYSYARNEALSINAIDFDPYSHNTQVLPLGLMQTQIGKPYQVSLNEDVVNHVNVILEDVATKKFHFFADGPYTFLAQPNQLERFKLHITTNPNWEAAEANALFDAWVNQGNLFLQAYQHEALAHIQVFDLRGVLVQEFRQVKLQQNEVYSQILNLPNHAPCVVKVRVAGTVKYIKVL